MIKLIATDLDGTLLDEKGQLDKGRLRHIVDGLKRLGIYFVIASGRSYLSLRHLFADFEDDVFFVAENGALVTEGTKIHHEVLMPPETYLAIVKQLDRASFSAGRGHYLLSGRQGGYVLASADEAYTTRMTCYYERVQQVASFEGLTDAVYKVTADLTEGDVLQGSQWLTKALPGVTAMTTGFQSIDVMQEHVDKRSGLDLLCRHLGLESHQILAFGDNLNDYEMLQFAGKAVAPANAREEIKAIADQVIASNAEGAVLTYLEEFLDGY